VRKVKIPEQAGKYPNSAREQKVRIPNSAKFRKGAETTELHKGVRTLRNSTKARTVRIPKKLRNSEILAKKGFGKSRE
jgi:hypothetical protein